MRTMLPDGTYIRIRNLRAAGIIGVDESERASAQPLNVNLWLQIDAGCSGTTDALRDTIDYRLIRQLVLDRIAASLRRSPKLTQPCSPKVTQAF